ncbi:hypothetical protein G7066_14390 [Leucobacter coleopterorum]|uniref:Oxygen-dependent protoporphyrinogen oxidase n=1 Tax=Leucobacter coleopterorum TaxID=2714933 RepID=A0ABX6K2G7_9MICO|nr:hypothetical protein [Leucobacter coleopterorum]QIM19462.1 hypothetical protein G7066_14390 [Leucobacter coleopterorum]
MTDAYVIGTTLPALAAALELAEVGLDVRVALDGFSLTDELDHSGELDPEGFLAAFLTHLAQPIGEHGAAAQGAEPVLQDPRPFLLRNAKGGWSLQPTPAVWGIPAVPMSAQAMEILGGRGATRATLDRVKPVLTIGKTHELGALVRNRMGRVVEDRLVNPLVRERYGVAPDSVDVALAAPGLNEALTTAGSLSGAALANSDRYVARETRVAPASGWKNLVALLVERLKLFGVEFAELPVESVQAGESENGAWVVSEFGGQDHSVRSVIADTAAPLPSLFEEVFQSLVPEAGRIWTRAQIEDPKLPDPEHPALQNVEVPGQGTWSVRIEHGSDSRWFAQLSGPRVPGTGEVQDGYAGRGEAAVCVSQVLERLGLRASSEYEVEYRVAPSISTASRDAKAARLVEQRESNLSLLPVGAGLHGGEIAAAVADARQAAVMLRRRLTGISE